MDGYCERAVESIEPLLHITPAERRRICSMKIALNGCMSTRWWSDRAAFAERRAACVAMEGALEALSNGDPPSDDTAHRSIARLLFFVWVARGEDKDAERSDCDRHFGRANGTHSAAADKRIGP